MKVFDSCYTSANDSDGYSCSISCCSWWQCFVGCTGSIGSADSNQSDKDGSWEFLNVFEVLPNERTTTATKVDHNQLPTTG